MLDAFAEIDAAYPWLFAVFAFVLGTIVGSFLNVCIYRIPAGKSVVSPGSACACGQPIAWHDNIPILSWFLLRGRARCCGRPYGFRYPLVEALCGGLFLLAWLEHSPAKAACLALLASLLVCASFIDWDTMEIPDRFSLGCAAAGLACATLVPSLHGYGDGPFLADSFRSLSDAVLGLMVGSGMILWIALFAEAILRKEAMGFGDVKLMGGIGAFLGWEGAVCALFGGAMLGSVAVAPVLLARSLIKWWRGGPFEGLAGHRLPFGPLLAAGALLYALGLEDAIDAYFALAAEALY